MRQKLSFILMFLLFMVAGRAVAETSLIVQKTDGTRETFLLSEKPEMVIEGENCAFSTANVTLEIPRVDIEDLHFEDTATGIGTLKAKSDVLVRFANDHTVQIAGLGSTRLAVYDISGKAVNADISTTGDTTTISLGNMPSGTYIINYGKNSIKILKK